MDEVLHKAMKRRLELETELDKLDQFIDMYRELQGTSREPVDTVDKSGSSFAMSAAIGNALESAGMIRPRGRPADFANIMETILKDEGHPMQRGEFVEQVEKRGHIIPSEDKPRYLGTILWRREDKFQSIEGRGYWLKDSPVPEPEFGEPEADPDLLDGGHTRPTFRRF